MQSGFINEEDYKNMNKYEEQLLVLKQFVRDNEWYNMLKFDIALNPKLAEEIVGIIKSIDINNFNSDDYKNIILTLRNKCMKLKNMADSTSDTILKWYNYRWTYAYYGLIEVITEGSLVTDKILSTFKEKYGNAYLDFIKKIDKHVPSSLTNFSVSNTNDIDLSDENIKIYLLMKYFQDDQHIFHEQILIKDHQNARRNFEAIVKKEYPHLNKVNGKNLLMLVILDNIPIIDINILSRFIIATGNKDLSYIIGGKGLGLSILNTNGFNIPKTYIIPVTSLKEELYKGKIQELKNINYSVRSSATVEDNENNSFAGMFTSVLDVEKPNLSKAVEVVKRSINNPRVVSYVNHFNTDKPYMSVVIQKYKEPTLSGVWIGNDINSGYLEWVNGNGEKLVSGHVKPISEKWPNNNEEDNLMVQNECVGNYCLELQRKLNASADLEWCILDGELVWLQYRPVTKKIEYEENKKSIDGESFVGVAASSGEIIGRPFYLDDPNDVDKFIEGSILLTEYTDPDWVPVILKSSGIITAEGGFLSHTAIISRELGIPCVTGLGYDVINKLKEEDQIEVNGSSGCVKKYILKRKI